MPSSSALAMFPCLRDFEATARARADVVGVAYTGSLARGTFDRFSDLDIHVWFDDGVVGAPGFRDVMGWLGRVHFAYDRAGGLATGFVGPEWRRVGLYLGTSTAIGPQSELVGGSVVVDRTGRLAAAVAASTPEPVGPPAAEQARAPHEQVLMTATWPIAPERDEVRRAARALWTWTLHVWAEAERTADAPIDIAVTEAELLSAVDRIHTWL